MRIEKTVEKDGNRVTVYIDDDTVRATDSEDAVKALIHVLAMASGSLPDRPQENPEAGRRQSEPLEG